LGEGKTANPQGEIWKSGWSLVGRSKSQGKKAKPPEPKYKMCALGSGRNLEGMNRSVYVRRRGGRGVRGKSGKKK